MISLKFLEDWYRSNCDGDWEHSYRITIETLDNPGWMIKVDLTDTDLENLEITRLNDKDENNWMSIITKDKQLLVCGDPTKLETLLLETEKLLKGKIP